jgi:O-antigen ligase
LGSHFRLSFETFYNRRRLHPASVIAAPQLETDRNDFVGRNRVHFPGEVTQMLKPKQVRQRRIATLATAVVLLAFMPFVGRVDAISASLSGSRLAELALLSAGTFGSITLSSTSDLRLMPRPAIYLIALVVGFSLWAMLTSFTGPLVLTGTVKAIELLAVCFISLQITVAANTLAPGERFQMANAVSFGVIAAVTVLMLANVASAGTALPLSTTSDWFSGDVRDRLLLGSNSPLTSALVLAIGLILILNARLAWGLKLPVLLALGWLLHLCDARGIEAGCLLGVFLLAFRMIPSSPYKLLAGILVGCGALLVALSAAISTDLNQFILHNVGADAFTLNSRTDLWSYMLSQVRENPIVGVGYYSTRVYILDAFPFAGHAHNSAIEVLFATGLVGEAFLLGFYCLWAYTLVSTSDPIVIGITPITFVESNLNPIIFTPDVGMFFMLLVLLNALLAADKERGEYSHR